MSERIVRERQTWTRPDFDLLCDLWYKDTPVILISLRMNRPISSVTTQASRYGLPPRKVDDSKHRRRWTPAEDTVLDHLVERCAGLPALMSNAAAIGRSLDAVVNHVIARHGQAGLLKIFEGGVGGFDFGHFDGAPPAAVVAAVRPETSAPRKNQRACMKPTCRTVFITPDRARQWYCPKCRKASGIDD